MHIKISKRNVLSKQERKRTENRLGTFIQGVFVQRVWGCRDTLAVKRILFLQRTQVQLSAANQAYLPHPNLLPFSLNSPLPVRHFTKIPSSWLSKCYSSPLLRNSQHLSTEEP